MIVENVALVERKDSKKILNVVISCVNNCFLRSHGTRMTDFHLLWRIFVFTLV